jgi:hypothetical protein
LYARKAIAPAQSFLRGAGLVAGILGMHVMTGNHTMQSPAAIAAGAGATTAGTVLAASAGAGSHTDHPAPAASHAHPVTGADEAGSSEQG